MRREYKLGENPLKWFDEGDFPLSWSDYSNAIKGIKGLGTGSSYGEIPTEILFDNVPIKVIKEAPHSINGNYLNHDHLLSKKFIDAPGIIEGKPTQPWSDSRAWK